MRGGFRQDFMYLHAFFTVVRGAVIQCCTANVFSSFDYMGSKSGSKNDTVQGVSDKFTR